MNKLKKSLLAAILAGMVIPTSGMAASALSMGMSAIGMLISAYQVFFSGGYMVAMIPTNIDPPQLAAEGYVLYKACNVKNHWDPEPEKEYKKAAQSNGAGGSSGPTVSAGDNPSELIKTLPFLTASLYNVGIEAINVGRSLSEIATDETRTKILGQLGYMQPKGAASNQTTTTKNEGAGSCSANYSVCSNYSQLSGAERDQVATRQTLNQQNYGTAGLAHAELGLKAVQQAIANDGDSQVDATGASSSATTTLVHGTTNMVQDLSKLIGTGENTVAAMKIVSLMNLELAGRLNQGNMMQGSVLTIEAARAFPNTSALTD